MNKLANVVTETLCLIVVVLGVEHYTGHWCIAIAAFSALLYLK